MARLYSIGPRTSSTKRMKSRKKTLLKDMGVHTELTQLLNARLSQLKGSSDEFHILRTAHHEGSFEDRWPQAGSRSFIDHPSIIEKFAEVVPPNEMTPAFVDKLMATQGRVSDLIKDSQQLWLDNVKSFSVQMQKASTNESVDLPFDELSESSFAENSPEHKSGSTREIHSLVRPQTKKKTSPPPDVSEGSSRATKSEMNLDADLKSVSKGIEPDLISELGTIPQIGQEESTETVSFYIDHVREPRETAAMKRKTKTQSKKEVKERNVQANKKDIVKLNALFNIDLEAYITTSIFTGMIDKAISTLKFYSYFYQQPPGEPTYRVNDIMIFSSLMHAAAKKGKFGPLRELFEQVMKNGLKPSLQCYAACLECLARQDLMDIELGQHIISDLHRDGFKEEDIFKDCIFKRDERQYVLKALKTINPQFEPQLLDEETGYNGPLLKNLNYPLNSDQMVEVNPYVGVIDNDTLLKQMEQQQQQEQQDYVTIQSVIKKKTEKPRLNEKTEKILEYWKKTLLEGFQRKLHFYETKKKFDNRMSLYPYMKLFPHDTYVNIMFQEAKKLATDSESFSPGLGFLWLRMGYRVYYKYLIQDKLDSLVAKKMNRLYRDYIELYNDPNLEVLNYRILWKKLQMKHIDGPTLDVPNKTWPIHVIKGIGRILFDIVLYDLKIENPQVKNQNHQLAPAFYTVYRNYSYITKEEVKPHPRTMKLFQSNLISELTFDAVALPMLVPPVPWISVNVGSNLLASTKLIRLPDSVSKSSNTVAPSGSLNGVYDGLNTLSSCPWIINKPILDLIIGVFNNKGNKDLDIPPPATECPQLPKITNEMSGQQRSRTQRMRVKLKQQKTEMHGLWCNELYKLSIANHFRDNVFWFPHNMDFRGRTYPCPPHFNHLGSDVTRSILLFAKGQKLGPHGLDWLKIHLINLTGFKKRSSNAERLNYANKNMAKIFDSADHPMDGKGWWKTSDEPWQTLACCMEIAKAVRSPDPPEDYVSHFPVHQDGSCNGLQHYAALGRDKAGADSVNLSPSDRPQDVYSDVCELVERERARDAKNGNLIAQKLEGFVKRKVIKQTVMTTVYGVTRYGAKYQILKQLKDLHDFDNEYIWQASAYLTEKTFLCLAEMFTATKDIQMWLTFCAHHITTVSLRPVEWITPLGLHVVQPYHKTSHLQRWGVSLNTMSSFDKPNSMKQKNAFAPNFIHSLDSTHMLLTALYCLREGITYVSVHDCFWTHPSSVEIMNKICREQFVALHSQPILEDLSKYFLEKFNAHPIHQNNTSKQTLQSVLRSVPGKGKFKLDEILKSTYFFS